MVSTCLEKVWVGEEKVILFFKFTLRVGKCTRYWYTRKNFYCRFSYVGTWELVHLLLGTKNFSYHIFCENIDRKHNKISTLKSRDIHSQETYHWQIEPSNTLVKNNVLNEIKKEATLTRDFKDCKKVKGKVSQNLDDLQNLLIKLTETVS